ncbi:indole-3-glycerol phosphate synthase TrpC [Niabella pedocola]|uniref:Indole-3-glycerol phosphate synthase n=1 Tax=Niabella pedocola TaxID=1752077 RepID=A0ABS8PYC1_9BACT|nr:indole-3-glycerol phosphate synthase TrpC [Niabella pedocola]MCD2426058.1 indole-3-glycerol phosphate synthase TrpC [Niabella pedocola]
MNILDTIIEYKRKEVAERKVHTSVAQLEQTDAFGAPVRSLAASLQAPDSTGIIAEFKRKSPSKGFINKDADVATITGAYTKFGAAALSVLTDEAFFGGSSADLIEARKNAIPVLRKDFIVDEYQIVEAKSMGADIILLIAACLTPAEVERLAVFASSLGLETILELHAEEELEHVCAATKIVGINNRDLKTFSVDIERSLRMAAKIPEDKIKIAESGIDKIEDILLFRENGFKGFLIGEYFMRQEHPPLAFEAFVNRLKEKA